MTTVRHIERLWNNRNWGKLLRELLANRPEHSTRLESEVHSLVACAAIAMIRLDELNQTHTPLFSKLLRTVLCSQDADGGWRDPITTALCVRALLIDGGEGLAIDRGLSYLATMQKDEGVWPKVPIRRMPADAFVSAFVLFELADNEQFRCTVRFDAAIDWCEMNEDSIDDDARRLWDYVIPVVRIPRRARDLAPLWS